MEFHLYMSFICMQGKCRKCTRIWSPRGSPTLVGPLGPRRVAGARSRWRPLGPTWRAPPHLRCHITDPRDFTSGIIWNVKAKSVSSEGREQVSHGLWFSTMCTNASYMCQPTYLWSKLPLRMIWSHRIPCRFRWGSARHRILAPATPLRARASQSPLSYKYPPSLTVFGEPM